MQLKNYCFILKIINLNFFSIFFNLIYIFLIIIKSAHLLLAIYSHIIKLKEDEIEYALT